MEKRYIKNEDIYRKQKYIQRVKIDYWYNKI